MICIMVTLGYSFTMNKQGFRVLGGVHADLITSSSGEIPGVDFQVPQSLRSEMQKEIVFGWNAEIGYFREISPKWLLELRTYYGGAFSNMLKNNNAESPCLYVGKNEHTK